MILGNQEPYIRAVIRHYILESKKLQYKSQKAEEKFIQYQKPDFYFENVFLIPYSIF